jgi:hypothetical protein
MYIGMYEFASIGLYSSFQRRFTNNKQDTFVCCCCARKRERVVESGETGSNVYWPVRICFVGVERKIQNFGNRHEK